MRVVITRPLKQAGSFAEKLRSNDIEPILFPTIQIAPIKDPKLLDFALKRMSDFDWVIFTSANAVSAVWDRLEKIKFCFPEGPRVGAIGSKTSAQLSARGVKTDFIPDDYVAEAIVPGLGDLKGKRVLIPQADIAGDKLEKGIEAAGGKAICATAYHTLPADLDPAGIAALKSGVDAVTFTSGSTARNFIALTQRARLNPFHLPGNPLIACIGPKTAAIAREEGLRVDRVAAEHTEEGLLQILLNGESSDHD